MGLGGSTSGCPSFNHWTVVAGAGDPEKVQLIDAVSSSLRVALTGCCWTIGGAGGKKRRKSAINRERVSIISIKNTYRSPPDLLEWIRCGLHFRPDICTCQRLRLKPSPGGELNRRFATAGSKPDRKVPPTRWLAMEDHRVRCKSTQLSSTRRNNSDGHWSAAEAGQWPFWRNH